MVLRGNLNVLEKLISILIPFTVTDETPKSTAEQIKEIPTLVKKKAQNVFRKKLLFKRVPILTWLPNYSKDDAIGDLIAGITVGLTVIPQALAYAGIADLPAAYGLYGSFLGCFVYIFLGSCKDVPMGPTAIASLLTFQAANGSWEKAVLLCFLTGCIELLMGLFGLGFLIDFVSGPVSSGFTSAAALIIFTSQVKDIFGIKSSGGTFLEMWSSIIENMSGIRVSDTILGFSCIVILLLMRVSLTFYSSIQIEIIFCYFYTHSFFPTSKSVPNVTTKNQLFIKSLTKPFG